MHSKCAWTGLGLLLLAGCYSPVRPAIDHLICSSVNQPLDQEQVGFPDEKSPQPANPVLPAPLPMPGVPKSGTGPGNPGGLQQVGHIEEQVGPEGQPKANLLKKLEVPPDLAYSELIPITGIDPRKMNAEEREKAAQKYFPLPSDVGADPQAGAQPGPAGRPLTLADLQKMARANSPQLRQAAANVESARGAMVQSGLYSNPTVGWQSTSSGPSGGPLFGPYIDQTISTMGKLKLAQAAAQKDLDNAELAYRRAETDLSYNVRQYYFAVLVAMENIRQNRALVSLTDEVFKALRDQYKNGELSGSYEPMQVGVFDAQARIALIQARNSYIVAWKDLAANLGLTGMPPTQVAGSVRDMGVPKYQYDTILQHVLNKHTDMLTAYNTIQKARYNLRLAEVTAVPDINVQLSIANDETPPGPNQISASFQIGGALPIWNLNQGNVWQAKAQLVNAMEQPHTVRINLTTALADAYRRYIENQQMLDIYRKDVLPRQVASFRAAVKRHYFVGPAADVGLMDLVTSEQNLVAVIASYMTVVQGQWQAIADVANLLQTDDIYQVAEGAQLAQSADLPEGVAQLLDLPCCHPCNPTPDPKLQGADPNWPTTGFPPVRLAAPVLPKG